MNTGTSFSRRISNIKKHIVFNTIHQIVFVVLFISLCCYTVAVVFEKTGSVSVHENLSFYGISLSIAFVLALGYSIATRKRLIEILVELDTRLHLQDRISTAYEYQTSGKPSDFGELLLEDAGQKLARISNKHIFPPKFSKLYWGLSILLVINIGILFVDSLPLTSTQTDRERDTSKKISALLKDYTKKKTQDIRRIQEEQQKRYRQLENIAKKLEEQPMARSELLNSLHQMLNEVQSSQTRLTHELGSNLENIEDFRIKPVQSLPRLQQFSQQDLEKLQQMLNNMLNNQIPESLKNILGNLNEVNNLEQFLSQLIEEVESGADEKDSASDDEDNLAQSDNNSGEDEQDTEQEQASSYFQKGEDTDADQRSSTQRRYDEKRNESGNEGESSDDSDEGGSLSAGHGKSDENTKAPYDLESQQGPALPDKTISSSKSDYNIHIRSVTTIGEANVPKEDVTRPYQREIESILQKEDIPVNYREYIKNYFISIGLRKE